MFDAIYIGMSGMEGFSKGLKVISNNVANLNTPGFKSSGLQFTDAYYQQGSSGEFSSGGNGQGALFGNGLTALATTVSFQAGSTQQTSNPLDVAISGDGFLVTQDKTSGARAYTRDGQLQFDKEGTLVSTTTGKVVLGYPADGAQSLQPITLDGLKVNPPKATANVLFNGRVTSAPVSASDPTIPETKVDFAVDDTAGEIHSLHLSLKNNRAAPTTWDATITDGTNTVGTGTIGFINGRIDPVFSTVVFNYKPTGSAPFTITLDFSKDVDSLNKATVSTLAVTSQDGFTAGSIVRSEFDQDGKLSITYSNGQTTKGSQLALARFDAPGELRQQGGGEFTVDDPNAARMGRPNGIGFGGIASSRFEMSNVDLSGEFSNLIVMQRGYQASSNVLSTANEMLQQLFEMRGGR